MRKLLSKILPCILVVLVVLGLASCNGNKGYKHPEKEPMVSNPNEAFLQFGQKTISKKAFYNDIKTNGLEALVEWMDEITLADFEIDEEEFEEHLNYVIYGTTKPEELTAEEKAEAEEKHNNSMLNQGYATEEEWREYYELEYKRYAFGLAEYEKHVDELNQNEKTQIFDEEIYQTTFESIFQNDYTVILVTFDSEYEARQVLAENNVDINNLTFGWHNEDGAKLTADEVKAIFTTMHNAMYPGVEAEQTYKHIAEEYKNELANYSATIANKVAKLSTIDEDLNKAYTFAPLSYGSRYYLALKVAETDTYDTYENATEEQKAEVKKYLLESSITSAFLLVSAQKQANLKIYDEGLEIAYKLYYNDNIKEAGLDLDAYTTTTDESSSVVAEFTFNGQKYTITADELFERLVDRYGESLALLYAQEYVVLSNSEYNKVLDYFTGEVLDKETYDKYYKTDITAYKEALEKGDYESKGFPANYGWENFMVDYFGVETELELMLSYASSLYYAAEGYLIKDIYMDEEVKETDEEGNEVVTQTADHLVQAEMEKIFNEYFSASMIGVYAYFDREENALTNNVADEMTEEQEAIAKELVELVYETAKQYRAEEIDGTLAAALEKVVKEYKSTTGFAANQWAKYKKLGIQLTLVTSTTYTNTSTADEAILNEAQKQWELVKQYKNDKEANDKGIDALGQTLDPGYRNVTDGKITYLTAEYFGDKSEAFISNNAAYRLVITKAFDHTYIKKSTSLYKPTLAEYESYVKDSSNVSSAVATAIKTYYTTAIANLTKTEIVNKLIFSNIDELINSDTMKFVGQPELKESILEIVAQYLDEE